jgi:hypothetical protein
MKSQGKSDITPQTNYAEIAQWEIEGRYVECKLFCAAIVSQILGKFHLQRYNTKYIETYAALRIRKGGWICWIF